MKALDIHAVELSNLIYKAMKTLYEQIIECVSQGACCHVDFKKRTLRLNNKDIKIDGDLGIENYADLDEWLDEAENLYDEYKYSKPTQRSMKRERKAKFRALSAPQLVVQCGHDALSNPVVRDVAQAKLEVFILLSLIQGAFNPNELFAKDWFYQGADKSFIILKDWF